MMMSFKGITLWALGASVGIFTILENSTTSQFHSSRRLLSVDFGMGAFSSYGEEHFEKIRRHYGVDNAAFDSPTFWNIKSSGKGGGKSGSDFVRSRCGKFCLKSANKNDFKGLKQILPSLTTHLTNGNHLTIPKYKCFVGKKKKYVIMPWIDLKNKSTDTSFDFKGSVAGRLQKQWNLLGQKNKQYKDNNLTAIFESVEFDQPQAASRVFGAVKNSVEYLKSQKLLDYSLILRVELGNSSNQVIGPIQLQRSLRATCRLRGVQQPQRITFHFMTVLDYLTPWGRGKSIESRFKRMSIGKSKAEPSCMKPRRYGDRLLAGLEFTFTPMLQGALPYYEAQHNKKYSKRVRYNIRKTADKGDFWLQLMGAKPSQAQIAPTQSGGWWVPYSSYQPEPEMGTGMLVLLLVFTVVALACVLLFIYVLVRRDPKRKSFVRKKPPCPKSSRARRKWDKIRRNYSPRAQANRSESSGWS